MALPLRPLAAPHCAACIRTLTHTAQQVRGKKTLANAASTVPVRLLKNVKTFGRRGAVVPISMGQMRNDWFPRNIAGYITAAELKTLRDTNVPMERNFDFGLSNSPPTTIPGSSAAPDSSPGAMTTGARVEASMFARPAADTRRISPERSAELVEIFVPARLDFYRQPILEEKEAELPTPPAPEARKSARAFGSGAAADLLAARADRVDVSMVSKPARPVGSQAIYGSVSTTDVLAAVKAVMAENDEAARVVLHADDVRFVHPKAAAAEEEETDRVKFVGEFAVELLPRGAEVGVSRVVRVHAQEAA
ncbi:hypothetical protein LTR08_008721 [Meristemomyces frigidus]|nr:hypothetical protein LTR08_008721 [Meristemomyces frigidus]